MSASRRPRVVWLALTLLSACAVDREITATAELPSLDAVAVTRNPDNALSAFVQLRVRFADSVQVRYGTGATLDSVAPTVIPSGDVATVPVLGLMPKTTYALRAFVYRGDQMIVGSLIGFTTDSLPSDLPRYIAGGTDPSPGYVAFSAGAYGLVIDNTGRVVWYHRFGAGGPGLNFEPQPNGRYVARPPNAEPAAAWLEVDPLGVVTRTFGCARSLVARFHDLIGETGGGYWIMCDETRTMDLSSLGGVAAARVMGTVIQHVSASGALLFEWSPFDHFDITDLDAASRTTASVNWTHGNALTLDVDGNLIVSFRSLSEITKIDTRTGAVIWRMGGLRNQFTFQGGAQSGFEHQHGVRVAGPGELTLLDNLGNPNASSGERYIYDATSRIARLIESYTPDPAVIAQLGGTTQNLARGHVLVAFGNGERVEEYDAMGHVVWHILGKSGYVFRAQRIRSLYHPGT